MYHKDIYACMSNTLFIFDWDDTLFPTHWLTEKRLIFNDKPDLSHVKGHLELLSNSVEAILQHAQKYGTVMIITNSEHGWVAHSCAKFMPSIMPLIREIEIVSARSLFEPLCPDSPTDWKTSAFQEEVGDFTNILSIGDSESERHAVKALAATGRYTKSLKIVERSTPDQIATQLDLITSMLEMIVAHKHSIDVCCFEA